jgi:MFS family permease
MMFGSLIFGIIADKYGRRRVIVTSAILNTLFGVFTAFAPSYYWVLVARILVGFALSGASQGYAKTLFKGFYSFSVILVQH